jgi:hypothetical protein
MKQNNAQVHASIRLQLTNCGSCPVPFSMKVKMQMNFKIKSQEIYPWVFAGRGQPPLPFDWENLDELTCKVEFRFDKQDIRRLQEVLQFPEMISIPHATDCPGSFVHIAQKICLPSAILWYGSHVWVISAWTMQDYSICNQSYLQQP